MPKTSQLGRGIIGNLVLGYGPDAVGPPSTESLYSTQVGVGLVGYFLLAYAPPIIVPPPPAITGGTTATASQDGAGVVIGPNVRVTQETLEAVVAPQPNALLTQEVLEAVIEQQPNARVTQDVTEVVLFPANVGDTTARATQDGIAVVIATGSGGTVASTVQDGIAGIPSTAAVRVTQEVVEAVVEPQPNVLLTQETLEVIIDPGTAKTRVTQEVIEVIIVSATTGNTTTSAAQSGTAEAVPTNEWIVQPDPRIRWDGIAEDAMHPRGAWKVRSTPKIEWEGEAVDLSIAWIVHTKPRIAYKTGPGSASTECISSDSEAPEPEPTQVVGLGNVAY
jgi:hypothetical protein